jgi:hypothetical protein
MADDLLNFDGDLIQRGDDWAMYRVGDATAMVSVKASTVQWSGEFSIPISDKDKMEMAIIQPLSKSIRWHGVKVPTGQWVRLGYVQRADGTQEVYIEGQRATIPPRFQKRRRRKKHVRFNTYGRPEEYYR